MDSRNKKQVMENTSSQSAINQHSLINRAVSSHARFGDTFISLYLIKRNKFNLLFGLNWTADEPKTLLLIPALSKIQGTIAMSNKVYQRLLLLFIFLSLTLVRLEHLIPPYPTCISGIQPPGH